MQGLTWNQTKSLNIEFTRLKITGRRQMGSACSRYNTLGDKVILRVLQQPNHINVNKCQWRRQVISRAKFARYRFDGSGVMSTPK